MGEDRSVSESLLQFIETSYTLVVEFPLSSFACEAGQWNNDVTVLVDEMAVEIGEAKEGMNILNFL